LLLDEAATICGLNQSALEMFGYRNANALTGLRMAVLISRKDQQIFRDYWEQLSNTSKHFIEPKLRRLELRAQRFDATRFPIELSLCRLQIGASIRYSVLLRDLSESREKNQILKTIFDSSSDAYFILSESKVLDCNRSAMDMLGFSDREMLLGCNLMDFCSMDANTEFSRNQFKAKIDATLLGSVQKFEWIFMNSEGAELIVDVALSPLVYQGIKVILAIWHDVAERSRAEKAIRSNERKLRAVLDSTYQLMGMLLPSGMLVEINERALALIGCEKEMVIGKMAWETPWWSHSAEVQLQLQEGVKSAAAGELVRFHTTHQVLDGEVAFIDFTLTPIWDDQGDVMMIIAEGHDISALVMAEQAEAAARREAEEANQAKSAFLANVSHEIRTPMNAIMGLTRLCLQTDLSDQQKKLLVSVDHAAQTLLGLLNDVLDLSKIESGRVELEQIPFDLYDVISNVINVVAIKAEEKGLELIVNDNQVPTRLLGDPLRLRQVLTNLASNAVKFTAQGEVIVSVALLSQDEDLGWFRFSVCDTGIGLEPQQCGHIFESFTQADASTTREYGGTGLGLAISRSLVEMMGGGIHFNTEPGKGTEFFFDLPLHVISRNSTVQEGDLLYNIQFNIVVVDDNRMTRTVIQQMIATLGYRHHSVATIRELLDYVNDNQQGVSLVLLDAGLLDALDQFSAHLLFETLKQERIFIVTLAGMTANSMANAGEDRIADSSLTKPVTRDVLSHLLAAQLGVSTGAVRTLSVTSSSVVNSTPVREKPIQVLVVDDNKTNLFIMQESLYSLGCQVSTCTDGEAALKEIEDNCFDIILMDLQMPVMDGFEATRKIRNKYSSDELPILAMTANVLREHQERCADLGMNGFVKKPIDMNELIAELTRCLPAGMFVSKRESGINAQEVKAIRNIPKVVANEEALNLMRQLKTQLLAHEVPDQSLVSKIAHDLSAVLSPAEINQLVGLIENFQFQRAVTLLEALLD
jgi:polar amino acid transport system substrate-binding protein